MAISLFFIVYEYALHKHYQKDIRKEKLISNFSKNRMDLIKMVHLKEIDPTSNFFRFMLKATSYSIRSLYFYKDTNKGLEKTAILDKTMPILLSEKTKEEFKNLNSEQQQLFASTILNLLLVYTQDNYMEKILFKLYLMKLKKKLSDKVVFVIEKLLNKKRQEQLITMDIIKKSYSLGEFSYSY